MKGKLSSALLSIALVLGLILPGTAPLSVSAETPPSPAPVSMTPAIPPNPDPIPGGTLNPLNIPKYVSQLTIPAVMPKTSSSKTLDYYEIAARQISQQILPAGMPKTNVFAYGSVTDPSSFSYPSRTIEAKVDKPVRVKWINDLVDAKGNYLPSLLPIDQTLMWANPPGGPGGQDSDGTSQSLYKGPMPLVTHLHGAHVVEDSDGYPEAWTLPNAKNIPPGYARTGTMYAQLKAEAEARTGQNWGPGFSVYQYSNDQRATALWFHDHVLGITRTTVYSGLAGNYFLRGGPTDVSNLPVGKYEIPLLIQDKSFNKDGSLFYPSTREFFEGLDPGQIQVPYKPDPADGGPSDVPKHWNPEYFGNAMVVNGKTWPNLNVEQRQYRLRLLNGDDSRTLMLEMSNGMPFWLIGTDGGFLPKPVKLTRLLMGGAQRDDVLIDFSGVKAGTKLILKNVGPDEPFGGGQPGVDFAASNPATTGQVMQFTVVNSDGRDTSTPAANLDLPALPNLGRVSNTRQVSLNEDFSQTVFFTIDANGNWIFTTNPNDPDAQPIDPTVGLLGTLNPDKTGHPQEFDNPITENPQVNSTEIWEIWNFTADAHPIHLHQVQFEVVSRTDANGVTTKPDSWETGALDTVMVYPGDGVNPAITRIKAHFDIAGLFLWHCHILSHEDNEMMRPYFVGPMPEMPPMHTMP